MKINELLKKRPTLSFEIFPPKNNENDIREFIENNYPDINIISYNKRNSIYYDEYSTFHFKTYILDELILNNFNNMYE